MVLVMVVVRVFAGVAVRVEDSTHFVFLVASSS